MCLAVPMKVLEIHSTEGLVETGGIRRTVDLSLVSNKVRVGDYVVVHAGFAISVTNEEEARKTLDLFNEIVEATEGGLKKS